MNTPTPNPTGESRKGRLDCSPFSAAPRRHWRSRDWRLLLASWLLFCIAATCAYGQQGPSYGPPKIAYGGNLHPYGWTWIRETLYDNEGNVVSYLWADYYAGGSLAIFDDGQVVFNSGMSANTIGYYGNSQFVDLTGAPLANVAAVGGDDRFLALGTGVTAITWMGPSQLIPWSGGTQRDPDYWFQASPDVYVCKFLNLQGVGTFQVGQSWNSNWSPPYSWQGNETTLDSMSGDGWPATGIIPAAPPTIYGYGQPSYTASVNRTGSSLYYQEAVTYYFYTQSSYWSAGCSRYMTPNGYGGVSVSGSVWAHPPDGQFYYGSLDPFTFATTTTSGVLPAGLLSFGTPAGQPSQGPASIFWGSTTVPFYYHTAEGMDVYWEAASNKMIFVQPPFYGFCNVYGYQNLQNTMVDSYNSSTGTFSGQNSLLAVDANGNLLGTPPGVVAFYSYDPTYWSSSLLSADGSSRSPSYIWQTPSGSWGMKFINVPVRPFVVVPMMGSPSNVCRWTGSSTTDLIVSTSMYGWSASNIHPDVLYVNGVAFPRDPGSEYLNPSDSYGYGSVTYRSANLEQDVTLSWSISPNVAYWTGTLSYSNHTSGFTGTGTWDGGAGFTLNFTDPAVDISLFPGYTGPTNPTAPRYGPGQIAWDGIILTFNPAASAVSAANPAGDDVYIDASTQRRANVSSGGGVVLLNNGAVVASGTYNPAAQRFDFGPYFTGVVRALGSGQQLPGDVTINGSLDVYGGTLNFATDASDLNKPAFAWLHRSGPIVPGAPSGNHLRWLTATSLYEWTWEAPSDTAGHYSAAPLMALRSHPFPTLALTVPITNPSGPVVIGSYADDTNDGVSDRAKGVLVIAAGSKTGNDVTKRNALRVMEDGTVLVQPGGDISMGEFTEGPQP